MKYYKELETKDYLCVNPKTNQYYKKNFNRDEYEGRAVCIERNPLSIQTTGIHSDYLENKCKRVRKSQVPKEYLEMF